MPANLALVPRHSTAQSVVRTRAIDKALSRFEQRLAPRIVEVASRHPALADLALSFPVLLFALAIPRLGLDAEPLIARAIAGGRLDALARAAGVAGWLRALPPDAFRQPIPVLPDNATLRLRLANHRPRNPYRAALWFESVVTALEIADQDVAVWIASQLAGKNPVTGLNRHHRRAPARTVPHLQRLCLWAWASRKTGTLHDRLLSSGRWNGDVEFGAAADKAYAWVMEVQAAIDLGIDAAPLVEPLTVIVHGIEFVPIMTGADLAAEADAMQNCVRDYADAVAEDRCRLWSVRRAGARIATLETTVAGPEPWPRIAQLKARANGNPPLAVWQAARSFVEAQEHAPFWSTARTPRTAEHKQSTWYALWRPYWLEKRRIPAWLPMAYRGYWWI